MNTGYVIRTVRSAHCSKNMEIKKEARGLLPACFLLYRKFRFLDKGEKPC